MSTPFNPATSISTPRVMRAPTFSMPSLVKPLRVGGGLPRLGLRDVDAGSEREHDGHADEHASHVRLLSPLTVDGTASEKAVPRALPDGRLRDAATGRPGRRSAPEHLETRRQGATVR